MKWLMMILGVFLICLSVLFVLPSYYKLINYGVIAIGAILWIDGLGKVLKGKKENKDGKTH